MRKTVKTLATIALFFFSIASLQCATNAEEKKSRTALCTAFPIYQIARQIVHGHDGIQVQLMLPSRMGCPHDYALTPQDMRQIAKADVLVINGQGLEEFLGPPIERANPLIAILDSSAGIKDLLTDSGDDHHAAAINPHLFASPEMSRRQALKIAAGFSKIDPSGAAVYSRNAEEYGKKMKRLTDDFKALSKRLKNNRIITQHTVFDYLARDMGLEIVARVQSHAGQRPSAAEMLALIKIAKEKKAGAVFTEPQYADKVGKTIAKEAGIPSATLDPAATGPENAPLDYFEKVMKKNMKTLETVLGVE